MLASQAIQCFVGAWGYINATLTNTTTNTLVPEWHGIHPSGITVYDPYGHLTFILTANDVTEADLRPRDLLLPAKPTDLDSRWAMVAKHGVAAGGSMRLMDLKGSCCGKPGKPGLKGLQVNNFTTATLPAWVGFNLNNTFEFFDGGRTHVIRGFLGPNLMQTVYFYKM